MKEKGDDKWKRRKDERTEREREGRDESSKFFMPRSSKVEDLVCERAGYGNQLSQGHCPASIGLNWPQPASLEPRRRIP